MEREGDYVQPVLRAVSWFVDQGSYGSEIETVSDMGVRLLFPREADDSVRPSLESPVTK